jgi:CRISPR/Cas system-associated exonuclease Cas4 (RecB family)
MHVDIAAYYDIEKGLYRVIWDEANLQRRDAMISLLEKRIGEMAEALKVGKYGTTASNEPCKHCDFRQICRRRYALV